MGQEADEKWTAAYANHFDAPGAAPGGPPQQAIARGLRLLDCAAIELRPNVIRLRRPGMAITLSGIAQGFMTDRVADMLQAASVADVLVYLGEARALGHGPGGQAWRAGMSTHASRSA